MRKEKTPSKRQRIFEYLEPRNLLAGNVTADTSTNPTALTIIGDSSANVITITQTAPDTFKVAGSGTKVNGSNSAQTFYAPDGIFINLQGGNDVLTMKNLTINGELGDIGLGIMLDTGADTLLLSGVNVNWETAIDGGEGNNALVIDKCNFYYDLGIQTYGGTDAVTVTNTHVNGALQVQLGNGSANVLTMVNDTVTQAPGGPDMSTIPPGFEILECALPRIDCGANILGGSGVDVIAMNNVKIDCLTTIDTCGGVDSIAIVNSRFGNQPEIYDGLTAQLTADDGSGLCIETGLGNDAVSIVTTTVYGFLQVDTSGQVCCPCEGRMTEVTPNTPSSSSTKDGIDVVALTKVNVYAAEEMPTAFVTTDTVSTGCCCVDCGALLIYTGNQTDAVALASVCTDCYAYIDTTDCNNSSLDGADAVSIANSKFNQEDTCTRDTGLMICTGNGNDAVAIAKTNVVGKVFIDTGNGTDVVSLAFLVADHLCVEVGPGAHDVLTVSNCTATDEVFADDGGTGGVLNYKHLNNHFANPPAITISGWSTVV